MKRNFVVRTMLAVLLLAIPALTQTVISQGTYSWASPIATGQLGNYITFTAYPPTRITIAWTVTGTVPSACTFRVEGSPTGAAGSWTGLDATAPAADAAPCTSTNQISIADRPNQNLRIYLVAWTAGDASTSVVFSVTRGGTI